MWHKCKGWFIKHATKTYGKVVLGILSFFESIIIPIPIDAFMMLYLLVKENSKKWIHFATLTMITSVLGAVAGYLIAYFFFDLFGYKFIELYSAQESFNKVQEFFSDSVFLFTLIGAVTPIPYKIFVLTAGFMKVNFWVFLLASILGRSLRLYISAWLVHKYGQQSITLMSRYSKQLTIISVIVLVVYAIGYMLM